jgi:DNA-binding NarL/FixJ family response regulator
VREGLARIVDREPDLSVCCEAGNIKQVLQLIDESNPDMLIVDLALENGSGISLIENMSYSYDSVPILVFSIYDESVYAERCLKAGAKGYIMKHETHENIISAIRKVLNGKIYVDDKLAEKYLNEFVTGKFTHLNSSLDRLGNRELEVYLLLGQGLKRSDIAESLNLSKKTVENHIENIKKKMKFSDSHELHMNALRFNLDSVG